MLDYKVGENVILKFPDLGKVRGKIIKVDKTTLSNTMYDIQLTPINYIEETIIAGLLGYNKKCGLNFWSVKEQEDGSVVCFNCFEHMFYSY